MRLLICGMIGSVACSIGSAQSNTPIPPTLPTGASSVAPAKVPATASAGTSVTWTGTALQIRSRGDGLRSVLARVARATGMKVSGGVPDEPVFGNYGPGPVQQVLAALLDGVSVNMLLVNDSPSQPKELVLTARSGGATPPSVAQQITTVETGSNPDPADVNLAQPHPGRHSSPDSFQGPIPAGQGATNGGQDQATPGLTPVPLNDGTANDTTTGNTDANGTPQSPNGTRTAEQIFEELRRRQRSTTQ